MVTDAIRAQVTDFVGYLADIRGCVYRWDGETFKVTSHDDPYFQHIPAWANEADHKVMECFGFGFAGWDEFWGPYFRLNKEEMLEAVDWVMMELLKMDEDAIMNWGLDELMEEH